MVIGSSKNISEAAYRTVPYRLLETRHYIGVSTAKSWAESQNKLAELLLFSVLLRWGTKWSEWLPKRWSYTHVTLPCDRGDKNNTQYLQKDNSERGTHSLWLINSEAL